MGKRGIALIMAMLVIVVLSIMSALFFSKAMNENKLVNRFVHSTRALWLAEAGVAQAVKDLPNNVPVTPLGDSNHTFSAQTSQLTDPVYYQINSTGSVILPNVGIISRFIEAIVRTDPVDRNNFQHAIRTTSDLIIKGSVDINGPQEKFASLNFADLFEHTKEDIRSFATHLYTNPAVNVTPVDGITWIDLVPPEEDEEPPEFKISSDTWSGSGILVVAGDAQITGGTFNGIIYVIGKLRMSGNPVINGAVLVESETEIDTTLTGNVTINYDSSAIATVLTPLQFIAPVIVSWREELE